VQLEGLHHVTAITGDAPRNVDFYARLLGLRLVKKTVNFDAPDVYHLYYGDEAGRPGSIMTFFEFPGARRGRAGAGMVHTVCWRVASTAALDFWQGRLEGEGVEVDRYGKSLRFLQAYLGVTPPDAGYRAASRWPDRSPAAATAQFPAPRH
jgi:glyoxalase family protein